jgi:hypothetical protein
MDKEEKGRQALKWLEELDGGIESQVVTGPWPFNAEKGNGSHFYCIIKFWNNSDRWLWCNIKRYQLSYPVPENLKLGDGKLVEDRNINFIFLPKKMRDFIYSTIEAKYMYQEDIKKNDKR